MKDYSNGRSTIRQEHTRGQEETMYTILSPLQRTAREVGFAATTYSGMPRSIDRKQLPHHFDVRCKDPGSGCTTASSP